LKYIDWKEEEKRDYLARPLRWLESNRTQLGSFPVWLTESIDDKPDEGWIPVGGKHCLACEANLLEALADFSETPDGWIEEGMANLVSQWSEQFHNGIYYYKPDYGEYLITRCWARFREDKRVSLTTRSQIDCQLNDMALKLDSLPSGRNPVTLASRLRRLRIIFLLF